jgi:hypothetical protein
MSIGLKTKIRAGLELDDLIQDSRRALQEILNLSVVPALRAEQFVGKKWRPLSGPYELGEASPIIGLSIQGEPEMASVSIYTRTRDLFPEPDWKPEELGEIASVGVCGVRTGLSFALVAAVSVAIARRSGGLIADDMPFYTTSLDSSPEDFLSSIRVADKTDDYRAAANRFEQQLQRNVPSKSSTDRHVP